MISGISSNKRSVILIEKTVKREVIWNNVEYLKSYLRKKGVSLNQFQVLHEYLVYLQNDAFIFDCSATYFSVSGNTLYAFAKEKDTYSYRLDYINLENETLKWQKNKFNISVLLRIRNAIDFLSPDTTDDMCEQFISIITSDGMCENSLAAAYF